MKIFEKRTLYSNNTKYFSCVYYQMKFMLLPKFFNKVNKTRIAFNSLSRKFKTQHFFLNLAQYCITCFLS